MADRTDVLRNINNLAPRLYLICVKVLPEPRLAKELLSECLSVLTIKSSGHALALKLSEQVSNAYLFKQALAVLLVLVRSREFAHSANESAFYQLSLEQRLILLLRYRLGFNEDEIAMISKTSTLETEDQLFKAKEALEVAGSLSLERV